LSEPVDEDGERKKAVEVAEMIEGLAGTKRVGGENETVKEGEKEG
jgi:hypothetical protein